MHIYILGIHSLKGSKNRNKINLFWPYTYENVWQCKIPSLMLFTLTVYPEMNVKSWEKISIENEKGNIFSQTYLKFSYDWKWNSAEQNEEIVQWEYYTAFIFSTLGNFNFLLLLLCTVLTYLFFKMEHSRKMALKWNPNKRDSFLFLYFWTQIHSVMDKV